MRLSVRVLCSASLLVGLLAATGATAATQRHVRLTISITGRGTVRLSDGRRLACGSKCRKTFSVRAGARLGLTARPGSGWVLSKWSGACRGTKPTCGLRPRRAAGVAATFRSLSAPGSTSENPIRLGKAVAFSDGWQFTVLATIPDATQQILSIPRNRPPPHGAQYFMLHISTSYTGGASSNLYHLLADHFSAVGARNVSYSFATTACGVFLPPPDLCSLIYGGGPPFYSGMGADGNIDFKIASNDAQSLLLVYDDSSHRVWFALR